MKKKKKKKAALLVAPTHTNIIMFAHIDTWWRIIAAALRLSSKIPCTIKGKGLSVSHAGDYGTE